MITFLADLVVRCICHPRMTRSSPEPPPTSRRASPSPVIPPHLRCPVPGFSPAGEHVWPPPLQDALLTALVDLAWRRVPITLLEEKRHDSCADPT